ncbi:MAG: hypothetical protein HQL14_00690 [Candidatus Omnitrophica bacterium]|nr:hypothetical protein [Candidatus Omnitrophota bacterium]
MPQTKKTKKKGTPPIHLKKTATRIKRVRALQKGFAEVMTSPVTKLENSPVIESRPKKSSRKGFLNKACYQIGALFSDATALLDVGKKE